MAQALRSGAWWLTWSLGGTVAFVIPFFLAFILIGGVTSLVVDDVDAALDRPFVFPFLLAAAFAAGGTGLGLVQWLHVRKRLASSVRWIASATAGFATLALVHGATVAILGDALDTNTWLQLGDELVHNAAGGLVAGLLQWRFVLSRTGASRLAWVGASIAAFVAAGLTAWTAAIILNSTPGDAAPLGILAMTIIMGLSYRRVVARTTGATSPAGEPSTA